MNHIQRYLTEEVVEDYADGVIDRREALRRLGLLGVAAASALGPAGRVRLRRRHRARPPAAALGAAGRPRAGRPERAADPGDHRSPGPRAAR